MIWNSDCIHLCQNLIHWCSLSGMLRCRRLRVACCQQNQQVQWWLKNSVCHAKNSVHLVPIQHWRLKNKQGNNSLFCFIKWRLVYTQQYSANFLPCFSIISLCSLSHISMSLFSLFF